jgi:hypothetical protein
MLKNAWYLITRTDVVHSAPDFPRLPQASERRCCVAGSVDALGRPGAVVRSLGRGR